MSGIACAEFEVLLADYLDGTLGPEQKAAVELHQNDCAFCAELALDAAGAVAFMERVSTVNAPPALMNQIVFEVTKGNSRSVIKPSWIERLLGQRAGFVLQPRFAMGMAMAVLSLAIVGRFWAAAENTVYRSWDRAVKGYESVQLVYDVQSELEEWAAQRGLDSGSQGVAIPSQNPDGAQKQ